MSTTGRQLRAWQQQALAAIQTHTGRDFLVCASPGAGKTTLALAAAAEAFRAGTADQLVVVCPSDHLRNQWADAAADAGLPIDPGFSNSNPGTSPEFCGVAVTYAQVASNPDVHRAGVAGGRTFVILDEIHHAGDDLQWGDAISAAYAPAEFRLALTGTPWRSDVNQIPFVTYQADADGTLRSVADYVYSYGDALADGVVRPAVFLAFTGDSRWRDDAGVELAAHLGDPLDDRSLRRAWRTALNPGGAWIAEVLGAATRRLNDDRRRMPNAGGLVIATNQSHARAYAAMLTELTGEKATVVTSDNPRSSALIDEYRAGTSRWLVAVKQVSEGVDVPRLSVCVYATMTATSLFFTQAVGRVIRSSGGRQPAAVFLPSVSPLLRLAADLEEQRDHAIPLTVEDGEAELEEANRERLEPVDGGFQPLEATGELDRVIFSGTELSTAAALTLPGLLDVTDFLATLRSPAQKSGSTPVRVPLHRQVAEARRELHGLVGAVHYRTGAAHSDIHVQLRRRTGGPKAVAATLDQLRQRIAVARTWV